MSPSTPSMRIRGEVEEFRDPNWLMKGPLVIFSVLTVVIGFYAQPLLDFIQKIAVGIY